jgi:hypothetical protein
MRRLAILKTKRATGEPAALFFSGEEEIYHVASEAAEGASAATEQEA